MKRKLGEKRTRREEKPGEERVWRKREPGKHGIWRRGNLENGEQGDGGTWIKIRDLRKPFQEITCIFSLENRELREDRTHYLKK